MNATQLNMMVIAIILVGAGLVGVVVAMLSSQTLRNQGLRRTVKRWLQ